MNAESLGVKTWPYTHDVPLGKAKRRGGRRTRENKLWLPAWPCAFFWAQFQTTSGTGRDNLASGEESQFRRVLPSVHQTHGWQVCIPLVDSVQIWLCIPPSTGEEGSSSEACGSFGSRGSGHTDFQLYGLCLWGTISGLFSPTCLEEVYLIPGELAGAEVPESTAWASGSSPRSAVATRDQKRRS
jgi:hypothetical protein